MLNENIYLRPLASGLLLPANNGQQHIDTSVKIFPVGIDSDFTRWGLNTPSTPTPAARTAVWEMQKDGTFTTLFSSLSSDVKKLCLTQAQIVHFCTIHKEWLRTDGYATFFLFEEGGKLFVARVWVYGGGLKVDVRRFGYGLVWFARLRRRVVCWQQTL
jgi:hypothetical protein